MWEELKKDEQHLNQIEVVVQKNQQIPVTSSGSENLSSESLRRISEKDNILSYAASVSKRIEVIGEELKISNLDPVYITVVKERLESFTARIKVMKNQLKTMNLNNDREYAFLPLVSLVSHYLILSNISFSFE